MKLFKMTILSLLSFAFIAIPAHAVTVDFDTLTAGTNIDGVNLGGVTITSQSGITQIVDDFGVGNISAPNSVTNLGDNGFWSFMTNNDMTFTFDNLVSELSFTGGDEGGDVDQFRVTLYDISFNMIYDFTTPVFGGSNITPPTMNDNYLFSYSGSAFKYMVVGEAINAGIGIDDLTFNQVPEPATFLLLGSGLLGLVGLRRRQHQA